MTFALKKVTVVLSQDDGKEVEEEVWEETKEEVKKMKPRGKKQSDGRIRKGKFFTA
jgi:hypothetical protein